MRTRQRPTKAETTPIPTSPRRRRFEQPVTLVGHPFAILGMGEQLRSSLQALRAAALDPLVHDVFRQSQRREDEHRALIGNSESARLGGGVRIFHVNGDEIDNVLAALKRTGQDFKGGYNIVVPAWELPRYPAAWAEKLRLFDEVWAISRFVQAALASSGIDAVFVGQSVDLPRGPSLPRRSFGLRDDGFVVLGFVDLTSYVARKNPAALLELMRRLLADPDIASKAGDVTFVLKAKNGPGSASDWAASLAPSFAGLRLLTEPLSALETRSLMAACDCFVSLHRSEGFGRAPAEAMRLGRLAMATAWSGNTDYMHPGNSLLVPYSLVPVAPRDYPHAAGQDWAEPNIDAACALLKRAILDRNWAHGIAANGCRDIVLHHSPRAVGLRCLDQLERTATSSPDD